jgi:hypothetical protein
MSTGSTATTMRPDRLAPGDGQVRVCRPAGSLPSAPPESHSSTAAVAKKKLRVQALASWLQIRPSSTVASAALPNSAAFGFSNSRLLSILGRHLYPARLSQVSTPQPECRFLTLSHCFGATARPGNRLSQALLAFRCGRQPNSFCAHFADSQSESMFKPAFIFSNPHLFSLFEPGRAPKQPELSSLLSNPAHQATQVVRVLFAKSQSESMFRPPRRFSISHSFSLFERNRSRKQPPGHSRHVSPGTGRSHFVLTRHAGQNRDIRGNNVACVSHRSLGREKTGGDTPDPEKQVSHGFDSSKCIAGCSKRRRQQQ